MKKHLNWKKKTNKIVSLLLAVLLLAGTFANNAYAVKVRENEEYKAGLTLRPISEMFYLDKILEWKAWKSPDDNLNRASVPLRERFTGHVVNPLASAEAKVQSVPLMNSKNDEDNSVNGDEFDCFAFDFWQYVDQMVFWDGPIPTADVIDAGHRNGVPVYGTLFFNWSSSASDREILKKFLTKQIVDGKTIFPVADKLIDMVEFYGFDGYFINQETDMFEPWGETMREFMLYAQRKAKERKGRIRFSWYDAMSNSGDRFHYDGVTTGNDFFVKPYGADQQYAADEFFANFNWSSAKNDNTVRHMKEIGRNPFDAYAGFELQQRSYNTGISYRSLLDGEGKLKLSIGLYTPDSIRGMAVSPEDYHEQERNFWVGFDGDPTTSGDSNSKGKMWRGIARFVADKSAVMQLPFNTYFNTGHGRQWFIDGQVSKDAEWNSRGVQDILPTWRWWIRTETGAGEALAAKYDFTDAYNSGNSIQFYGSLEKDNANRIMLYSTHLETGADTKLKVAYKGGKNSKAYLELGTAEDYAEDGFHSFELPQAADENWQTAEIGVGSLVGQTIRSIRLRLEATENEADYRFNLGQLALYDDGEKPEKVEDLQADEVMFRTSANAEARLSWTPVKDAEYYEVYQENADGSKTIINATSSQYFYAEKISRTADMTGTTQKLFVVTVGKNGVKSDPAEMILDWQMEVADTDALPKKNPNLCLEAKVTDKSHENDSEPARNAINGTISGNTDKWCASGASGWMSIAFPEAKTVRRVAVYHAEAGGEGAIMNTRDFSIQYKDNNGQWQIAHSIRGNTQAVTDFDLSEPITAKEWKLDITRGDMSPWTAIRIYEWQMFEQAKDNKTNYIPMRWVEAKNIADDQYQVTFKNIEKDMEVRIYKDKDLTELLAEKKAAQKGDLVFDDLTLTIPAGEKYGKVYYVAKAAGMLDSIRMTLIYHKKETEIKEIELVKIPEKKVYAFGSPLRVGDGRLKLIYEDNSEQEIALTPSMVKGFNSNSPTEQELTVEYKGFTAPQTFTVTVKAKTETMAVTGLTIKEEPKKNYFLNEPLDLSGGKLEVIYEDLEKEVITMTGAGIEVSGFDSTTEGEKQLTFTYMDAQAVMTIYVSKKEPVNKEKLQETIGQVRLLMEEEMFEKAEDDLQQDLKAALAAAVAVFEDEDADKDQVAEAVANLQQAIDRYLQRVIKGAELKQAPAKTEYDFGEELDPDGGVVTVTYGNGRTEVVPMTKGMIRGYEAEKAGYQTLTVVYEGYLAGEIKVRVRIEQTEKIKALKAAIEAGKAAKSSPEYERASRLAKEALDNILRRAELLAEEGADENTLAQVIREIEQAILDLSREIAPLVPYTPSESQEPQTPSFPILPGKKEERIEDEKIAQASAETLRAQELSKTLSQEDDKSRIMDWAAKRITDRQLIQSLSDTALTELAENVAAKFKDEAKTNWYAKELSAVQLIGLVNGYEDGTFGANKEVTGKELTAILLRAAGMAPAKGEKAGDWFAPYLQAAEKAGLLKKVSFDLSKGLTREEVAALAYAFAELTGKKPLADGTEVKFTDKEMFSADYEEAITYLTQNEILKGYEDGSYQPKAPVKRSEVVAIVYRLLKK